MRFLLRGRLALTRTPKKPGSKTDILTILNKGTPLAIGRILVLVQDPKGRGRIFKRIQVTGQLKKGQPVASIPAPRLEKGGLVAAVYVGKDIHGERIVAEAVLAK